MEDEQDGKFWWALHCHVISCTGTYVFMFWERFAIVLARSLSKRHVIFRQCFYFWHSEVFRQSFERYDLDGNRTLAREELSPLLADLNIGMRIFVSQQVFLFC